MVKLVGRIRMAPSKCSASKCDKGMSAMLWVAVCEIIWRLAGEKKKQNTSEHGNYWESDTKHDIGEI